MIGTDPGIALKAKRDAMAIIAARPFYIINHHNVSMRKQGRNSLVCDDTF
jgi:hypothetical protein